MLRGSKLQRRNVSLRACKRKKVSLQEEASSGGRDRVGWEAESQIAVTRGTDKPPWDVKRKTRKEKGKPNGDSLGEIRGGSRRKQRMEKEGESEKKEGKGTNREIPIRQGEKGSSFLGEEEKWLDPSLPGTHEMRMNQRTKRKDRSLPPEEIYMIGEENGVASLKI